MKRLTNKELHIVEDINKALDKLSQLEDIEEELGIDLITLFKALTNGVYVKENNKIVHYDVYGGIKDTGWLCIGNGWNSVKYTYYGKTWSLTREELEK